MLKEIEKEGVRRDRSHWTAWNLWTALQTGMLKEIEVVSRYRTLLNILESARLVR